MKTLFTSKNDGMLSGIISAEYPYISFRYIKRQICLREVKVNGIRVLDDTEIKSGDKVEAFFPADMIPEIRIKYADPNIIIAYKDAGLETVGQFDMLIKTRYPDAEPVHRLDRNTEGLIIFSRNDKSKAVLTECLNNNIIKKFYQAEVIGRVEVKKAELNAYLFKDSKKSLSYVSDTFKSGCVPITTAYKVIEYRQHTTLLEVELITGKTHQIRAHLRHLGHPISGDGKYGDNRFNKEHKLKRQQLCAYRLIFGKMPLPFEELSDRIFEVMGDC